jgi:aarF domain-containing kinase
MKSFFVFIKGGAKALYVYQNSDDPIVQGFKRSSLLYIGLGRVISHYRMIELKHKFTNPDKKERNNDFEKLHVKYADHVKNCLLDMRGFYIKAGQVLANRRDVLPRIYIEKLRTLEDAVPAMPRDKVEPILMREFKTNDLFSIFTSINLDSCLGSASIGQVHEGILRNGKKVAIKVQNPEAESLFRSDLQSARKFCSIFVPEQVIIFDELEKQFLTEFDYQEEAVHLETVYKNLMVDPKAKPYRFDLIATVPRPVFQFCTKHVLVMDFLKGPKLVDGIRKIAEKVAKDQNKSLEQLEDEILEKFEKEGLPPPYSGPSASTIEFFKKLLKVRDLLFNVPAWFINLGISFLSRFGIVEISRQIKYKNYRDDIPINSSKIMESLLTIHGYQLLINGYFNADPHPGNFLLLEDGKLGLIDYGQVKKITDHDRMHISKIIIALRQNNRKELKELAISSGYKSKYMNEDVIYKATVFSFDRDGRDVTEGLNAQQFMDKLYKTDPWESIDNALILPIRVSFLLRGIGLMLNHPVSTAAAWENLAKKCLSDAEKTI